MTTNVCDPSLVRTARQYSERDPAVRQTRTKRKGVVEAGSAGKGKELERGEGRRKKGRSTCRAGEGKVIQPVRTTVSIGDSPSGERCNCQRYP